MDIAVGDTIQTRKKHPCGASSFEVLRAKIEKNIKKVLKPGAAE